MDPADSLKPIASMWQWQLRGLCRTVGGSELFFHPENERGLERQQRDERAQQICNFCPVQRECLAHALACREPYGVWGGTTETERRAATHGGAARRRHAPSPASLQPIQTLPGPTSG